MQIFELTHCDQVQSSVHSHVKFTCPKQSISKTPPLHGAEVRKGNGVMYAYACRQKGHFFLNFLTP